MCGEPSFAYPLEQRARLHLQVLGSFICRKPFGFHVNLFSRSGNTGSRRLCGRLCRVLREKRTQFLHLVSSDCHQTLSRNDGHSTNAAITAHHKAHSRHTLPSSYSVTSGFITKCPRVCEALVGVCVLSLRAPFTGASSTCLVNFIRYPERAVELILTPFSSST